MYAQLNTSEKLTVSPSDKPGFRFCYEIVNKQTGAILHTRYSNRKFVAATISGDYFSSIERVQAHKEGTFAEWDKETPASYYCYLEDTAAFQPDNTLTGPKLAYSLTQKGALC